MAGLEATVFLTIVIFLIVLFVSWGLGIRILSALAMSAIISIFFMLLCYPPVLNMNTLRDIFLLPGWQTAYWVIMIILIIYVFTYTLFVSVYDNRNRRDKGDCPSNILVMLEGDN